MNDYTKLSIQFFNDYVIVRDHVYKEVKNMNVKQN